jgi:hypothetical protein
VQRGEPPREHRLHREQEHRAEQREDGKEPTPGAIHLERSR